MFGLGHMFDILILLFIALLVFGPKRMIEMGSSFGKALRELRDATKEMNWTNLTHEDDSKPTYRYSEPHPAPNGATPPSPDPATVVESTIEQPPDPTA